ncbi:MAG: O-antigen ligase family protein [Firmicutes bacterium]|nr:O-antigen ligase family protein [Bacillota bacterium]
MAKPSKKKKVTETINKEVVNPPKGNIQIGENDYISYIFLLIISLFITIAPFYRGLFFRENYMPAIVIISGIFSALLIYKMFHKEYKLIDTYMDITALLIPVCYLVSFYFGVNAKEGFSLFLIYCSYFMLYKLVSNLSKGNEKLKTFFIQGIILSAFVTAFASILTLSGKLELNGVVSGSRLFGLYQYPNTTASVLAVGIVLAINAIRETDNLKLKLIYQVILTTLLPTFIFTLSRGGYIALVGVLLLNFLIIDGKGKLNLVINSLLPAISSSLFIYKYFSKGQAQYSDIFGNYITGVAIVIVLSFCIYALQKRYFENISNKTVNIVLTSMAALIVIALVFIINSKEPIEYTLEHLSGEEEGWTSKSFYIDDIEKGSDYTLSYDVKSSKESPNSYRVVLRSYNSENKHTELFKESGSVGDNFESKEVSFTTLDDTDRIRLTIYNHDTDSFTVYKDISIKDDMSNVVKDYKRFTYIPEAIANRLVNIKLDDNSATSRIQFTKDGIRIFKDHILIGTGGGGWQNLYRQYQSRPYNTTEVHNFYVQYAIEVGMLGLIALGAMMIMLIIAFIKGIMNKSDDLHVFLAVMLIFIHSAIDFNLSLVAVGYILWIMIGILNTDDNIKQFDTTKMKWIVPVTLALSVMIVVLSSSTSYGLNQGKKAADVGDMDANKSARLYEKAMKFDKYNSDYRMDYAQIMNRKFKETKDPKYLSSMLKQIELTRENEPYNYRYVTVTANLFISNGMLAEAVDLIDEKVNNEPMLAGSYVLKIELNNEIANYYFENSEHEKAIPYLEKIIEAKEQYDEVNSKLEKPIKLPKDFNMRTDLAYNRIEWAKSIVEKKK